MLDRRTLLKWGIGPLAGCLGLLPLASSQAVAQDRSKLRVALSWIANTEYAGLWTAIDKGYFSEEGLEIEVLPGGPNAPAAAVSIAAGDADIGYTTWLPYLDAVARGNNFKLLAVTFPVSPMGVISLPDKPILDAKDLVGAKILAQGPNERTAIDATLALNGLSGSWEFVPAGFSPEPLLAKQGDGYTAYSTNQVIALERMGLKGDKDFHFASFDSMGFKTFGAGLFTSDEFLKQHRAQVEGFLRALVRGWKDNVNDPSIGARLAVEKFGSELGLDLAQQTRQNEVQIGLMMSKGANTEILSLDRETISGGMYKAAEATGRKGLPEFDTIADLEIMVDVHKSLGAKP